MEDCNSTVVHFLLAQALIATEPYDARSGLVLLHSIMAGYRNEDLTVIDAATHPHVIASLGSNPSSIEQARWSMRRVVEYLEKQLEIS